MHSHTLNKSTFAVLQLLDVPAWVVDPHENAVLWANQAACTLWNAATVDALARTVPLVDLMLGAWPETVRQRVLSGVSIKHQQTIFLDANAVDLDVHIGAIDLSSGRLGLLIQARPVGPSDSERIFATPTIKDSAIIMSVFSSQGMVLRTNTIARQTFGTTFSLRSIFTRAADYEELMDVLEAKSRCSLEVILYTTTGKRWYAIEAQSIPHPAPSSSSSSTIWLTANDISARVHAEQAKEDLVAVVSHELRTPMAAIRGAVELLAGGIAAGTPELSSELLEIASENVRRLSTLVDHLLDLRKLANGRISIALEACNLQEILLRTVELQSPAIAAKNVELVMNLDELMPTFADEGRMQQIILNLLSNAVKHTPTGGRVYISGTVEGSIVRVSIADEGPGIPESYQDRIFERFSQTDSSSTRAETGAGLGLFMAKTLIELHGGRLYFENRHGGGAIFTFELRRRMVRTPSQAVELPSQTCDRPDN